MLNMMEGLKFKAETRMMEQRLYYLRTEAFSPKDFFQSFLKSIDESKEYFIEIIFPILIRDGNNKNDSAVQNLINKSGSKIERMNFLAHQDTLVPCPDGFKGEFFDYTQMLKEHNVVVVTQALKALEDFNTYLASFVGDKNSKLALKDNKNYYESLKKVREDQVKQIETFFTSGTNQRQSIEKMFDNKIQILESAKTAVSSWKEMKKIDPRDIQARCKMIVERLNIVIKDCQSAKDMEVSKQAIVNLADGAYELGRQVEHLGLYIVRNEIASVTSGNILERLNTILH